ncbi:MAG: bifunctional D-glycero-beta-D-manno-heptose-7-phosphate kinase/D-glycero-beta-D-manno-heptose 1-phosphate adenylyltransferase HldE [Acidobacteriota bacterium]|nr:bifunctional D-glycero-beta-D-manno-heptose-7-phosphate kinase/D-glycero-beta-D-manno-heptose 1-phosphate adenylyltransferase HldE [Acidobacteriota bacterium]
MDRMTDVAQTIEDKWPLLRVLVIGDVMLDKYIWGEVARISPEAPVPVVRATRTSERPGGAANVALNIARLGARTAVVGFTGEDNEQQILTESLQAKGVEPHFIPIDGFSTISKLRILASNQQMLRLDWEKTASPGNADYHRLLSEALPLLSLSHALVLSDYAKGSLNEAVCMQLIAAARNLDIPVLVDPKCSDFTRYQGATTICPNLRELAAAAGLSMQDENEILSAGEQLVRKCDLEFLAVTLSENGIAVLRPGSRLVVPAVARQVFDVSGAGDTVIAVLALCLASMLSPAIAVELANAAAGIVVGKVGTAPVEKHELLASMSPSVIPQADRKLMDLPALQKLAARWRAIGKKIVFTNGCFDLLHMGHIALLEKARGFGDRLIVAINSDSSVSALKGPSRPIVSERERGRVLAALAAVDAVVVFPETTPLATILAIRPDVLVKGGDYNRQNIVGAREIEEWGGTVKIVPMVEGFSTTSLIAKSSV